MRVGQQPLALQCELRVRAGPASHSPPGARFAAQRFGRCRLDFGAVLLG